MTPKTITAALLALALSACAAAAQPAASLKDQIVGSWNFFVAEVTAPDGKKSFPFGETPKGILIFTADGRFAQIHVAGDVPKIASNNRLTGTPEEYAGIMRRSLSVFGSYTVDEAKRTVTYKIVSSSFPNWEGEAQTRNIDKLTAESSSTPIRTWPAGGAVRAIFTGGGSRGAAGQQHRNRRWVSQGLNPSYELSRRPFGDDVKTARDLPVRILTAGKILGAVDLFRIVNDDFVGEMIGEYPDAVPGSCLCTGGFEDVDHFCPAKLAARQIPAVPLGSRFQSGDRLPPIALQAGPHRR